MCGIKMYVHIIINDEKLFSIMSHLQANYHFQLVTP